MVPEMRRLQAGFEVQNQLQEDEANGVTQQDRADLQEFDRQVQQGDWSEPEPVERETKTIAAQDGSAAMH